LRINTAVYGQRVLTVAGNEYKLEGYYPALITEGQYLRLQQIRETIKYLGDVGTGEKNNINLLAGLKLFRCGHCGSTMMAMLHRESIRYMCGDGRRGNYDCRVWSMPGLLVEHTLMLVTTIAYIDLQRKGRAEGIDYTTQIEGTEKLIADIGERINRATTLVINGLGNIEEVQKQMLELNEQRKHLVSDLEVLQRKQILSKDDTFESLMMNFFTFAQYGVLQDPMHDYRNKLRDIVRTSIGDVRTWKVDRRLYISFQIKGYEDYFNFSAGTTRYDWGCYLGELPFSSENISDEVVKEDIAHEQMVQFVEKRAAFERASMDMLREAQNLLSTVHYPELDGKMFWPRK
jgi:archaellum component FlaC